MSDAFVAALPEPRGDRRARGLVGARLVEPARRRELRRGARRGRRRVDCRGSRPRGRDGGVWAVSPARPPCSGRDGRRLLLLQQRRDRGAVDRRADGGAGRDPRRRRPSRQRHPADLLAPRRRPVCLAPLGPAAALPVLPRPRRRGGGGPRPGREPEPAAAAARRRRDLHSPTSIARSTGSPRLRARSSSSRSGSTPTSTTRSATSPSPPPATTTWAAASRRSAGAS